MVFAPLCYVAAGAAGVGVVRTLGKKGILRKGAVKVSAQFMRAADAVGAVAQSVADEASDINAEARRRAKIDAAVAERLAAVEQDIRAEVEAQVDAEEA